MPPMRDDPDVVAKLADFAERVAIQTRLAKRFAFRLDQVHGEFTVADVAWLLQVIGVTDEGITESP